VAIYSVFGASFADSSPHVSQVVVSPSLGLRTCLKVDHGNPSQRYGFLRLPLVTSSPAHWSPPFFDYTIILIGRFIVRSLQQRIVGEWYARLKCVETVQKVR
jgi:hypothetical protein